MRPVKLVRPVRHSVMHLEAVAQMSWHNEWQLMYCSTADGRQLRDGHISDTDNALLLSHDQGGIILAIAFVLQKPIIQFHFENWKFMKIDPPAI